MANRVVERLVVAVGAVVDRGSMSRATSAYAGLSSGIAAAGLAVAAFSIQQAAAIDVQAKAARGLALTTEEYSKLMFAADRSGVSVGSMTSSLRALQRQVQSAATGSKEAVEDFAALGIAIRDGNGELRTSADILPELADRLNELPDGERLGLQLRLLGRGGADMATLLGEGSVGITALTDRAEELGLVLDSETAAAGERLTDSMTDLMGVFKGFAFQVASETMPAVADFVDGLTGMLTAGDGFVQLGLDRAVRAVSFAMDFARTPAGKYTQAIVGAGAALGIIRGTPGLIQGLGQVSPLLGGMASRLAVGASAAGPYALALAAAVLVVDDMIVTAQGGDSAIRAMADAMGVGEETADTFADAGTLLSEAWSVIPTIFDGVGAAARGLWSALTPVLEMIPGMEQLLAMLPEFPSLGGIITGIGDEFEKAGEGFSLLARYAAGDESVVRNGPGEGATDTVDLLASGLVGLAGASRAESRGVDPLMGIFNPSQADAVSAYRAAAAQGGGSGVVQGTTSGVNVSVSVDASTSPADIARETGRETERQVLQALQAAEGA